MLALLNTINKYVGPALSGQNVHWPRHMQSPGESRRVCWRDRQTDRQIDGRTPDSYIAISARRGLRSV